MAWRDSRQNRSRLLLFMSSIIAGIAALVAIYSLSDNLKKDIDLQAASLLGADMQVSANKPVSKQLQSKLDSLGTSRSHEQSFASMVYFPAGGGTRLVFVRAIEGEFPYYGSIESTPVAAATNFRRKQGALVDRTLMLQFNAKVGDSVKIGNSSFVIEGTLLKAPGQTGIASSVAPVIFIPLQYLQQTGLLQKGSRISFKYYFKFKNTARVHASLTAIKPLLDNEGLDYETVESQKESSLRSFSDISSFLSIVGFISLLLGCIGVASAIHIYMKEKMATIAILRCLGVSSRQVFFIYLAQISLLGLISSITGAALGAIVQQFLPRVLQDFIAVDISTSISWSAILQGIAVGVTISALFALLPLVSLRQISPLNALRIDTAVKKSDPVKYLVYLLIVGFVATFARLQLPGWPQATAFTGGLITALLILAGIAALLTYLLRKFFPVSLNYVFRQSLANLHRPNNQTLILVVSIGLGTAFICILFAVQGLLLNRITISASGNQPNMVLFDIQTAQKESVVALARRFQLPVLQQVPIINTRLQQVNGKTAASGTSDSSTSRGAFTREFRVTYRDSLTASEKLVSGVLQKAAVAQGTIYVSLEKGYADRQNWHIGDTLTFNVQGTMIKTIIGSFREVDWNRIQTNFLVVFPTGVLEQAPQFQVLLTHVPSDEVSAKFQQAVVVQFPNISIIDLALVLKTLDTILDKIAFVIRFMAAFSIFTGLVVLTASVLISKYQRMQENVLLRTLGASSRQIFTITLLEYFFLGLIAAVTGLLLSLAATWALATYTFKTIYKPNFLPLLLVCLVVVVITMLIGIFNSRSVLNKSPLEILRQAS